MTIILILLALTCVLQRERETQRERIEQGVLVILQMCPKGRVWTQTLNRRLDG